MSVNGTFAEMVERNLVFFSDMTTDLGEKGFDELDGYQDNLYRAIEFAATIPELNAQSALLASKCFLYIEQRCNYRHWAKLLVKIANRYKGEDSALQTRILSLLGHFYLESGDTNKAERAYGGAERIALKSEDDFAVATASYYLATLYQRTEKLARSVQYATRAASILEQLPENNETLKIKGFAHNIIAVVLVDMGQFDHTEHHLAEAERAFSLLPASETYKQFVNLNAARLHMHTGQYEIAEHEYKSGIAYAEKYQLLYMKTIVLNNLAELYGATDRWEEAYTTLEQVSLAQLQRRGLLAQIVATKLNLSMVTLTLQQDGETALAFAQDALDIAERIDLHKYKSLAYARLAAALFAVGNLPQSYQYFTDAHRELDNFSKTTTRAKEIIQELEELEQAFALDPVFSLTMTDQAITH